MKSAVDFKDRMADLLHIAGFDAKVEGGITTETDMKVVNELVTITSVGVNHQFGAVDNGSIAINIFIKDIKGTSDNQRFRYLITELFSIIDNYKDYKDDFLQYRKDKEGTVTTNQVTADDEYFHFNTVYTDGVAHDPEREGYSYFSVRLDCWIEK